MLSIKKCERQKNLKVNLYAVVKAVWSFQNAIVKFHLGRLMLNKGVNTLGL